MEAIVSLSFSLPVSQAERVVAFVKSLGPSENEFATSSHGLSSEAGEAADKVVRHSDLGPAVELVLQRQERQELRYFLDPRLEEVVRFIVKSGGKFYNDELAAELGVEIPLTSTFLGHLTRKLRKTGVKAEGFRGTNWYSKVRSSGRTLIIVRSDVLIVLTKALEIK